MQGAEIELKFPVPAIADLEARLPAFGFLLKTPRTFEHNTLFDTPGRDLRLRHQLLRIRQYGGLCTLTHKRTPADADDSHYKTRIETETAVEDGTALASIFKQLGLTPVFVYEKFRTEWRFEHEDGTSSHLVIDETPIGTWAELEGPTHWIDGMLEHLGVNPGECSTASYGRLFLDWRDRTGHPAEHLTFAAIAEPVLTLS